GRRRKLWASVATTFRAVDLDHKASREHFLQRSERHRFQPIAQRRLPPWLLALWQILSHRRPMPDGIVEQGDLLQTEDTIRVPLRTRARIVLQALLGRILECERPLTSAKAATGGRYSSVPVAAQP